MPVRVVIFLVARVESSVTNNIGPRRYKHEIFSLSGFISARAVRREKSRQLGVFGRGKERLNYPFTGRRSHLLPCDISGNLVSHFVPGRNCQSKKTKN